MSRTSLAYSIACMIGLTLSIHATSIRVMAKEAETVAPESEFNALFDGKKFDGWSGNMDMFRIQDGAIVGGSMDKKVPNNEFLTFKDEFKNFELRLEAKLIGEGGNAGIQIRSRRATQEEIDAKEKAKHIPKHEMVGYQVDMGKAWEKVWWGKLYDESRRRKVLAGPEDDKALEKLVKFDEWNDYRILCEGPRIRIWLNGTMTVDYTESEKNIADSGLIGLQIHGGPPSEAWYRNVRIREISEP